MLVATPVYAAELARGIAQVEGETFDLLTGDARDRYYRIAAWVVDEYVTGDDFHEGCMPASEHYDDLEQVYIEAVTEENEAALARIKELGENSGDAAKATLRLAYQAVRGTESGEAMRNRAQAYVRTWHKR